MKPLSRRKQNVVNKTLSIIFACAPTFAITQPTAPLPTDPKPDEHVPGGTCGASVHSMLRFLRRPHHCLLPADLHEQPASERTKAVPNRTASRNLQSND